MSVVKNGCGYSGLRTRKLALSLDEINGINWFLVCWYKFRKAKFCFNSFWVVVVKNGSGLLGLGSLKFALSQEWIDEMSWFFACWYRFREASIYFNNYWVDISKMGEALYHGTLKSGVSPNWFDKLRRILIEWFLHADRDGIIFGLTASPFYFFDI